MVTNAELMSHYNGSSFNKIIFGYSCFCYLFCLIFLAASTSKLPKIVLYRNVYSRKIKDILVSLKTLMDIGLLFIPKLRSL